ncbi:MAG TPA: cytochrome P450 [Amycolatopsis sp.]|nr:cytochrome P450 [Amycolatopsis sp.]
MDFHAAHLIADPYPALAALREQGPVLRHTNGHYIVTRYEAAREALIRAADFSSADANKRMWTGPEYAAAQAVLRDTFPVVPALLTADPPAHTRHRGIVRHAFSPRRVRQLEQFIAKTSRELAESMPRGRATEFVQRFATVLPLRLIIDAVGADQCELDKIHAWSDAYVAHIGRAVTPAEALRLSHLRVELHRYLADRIARSQTAPADDIIGDLVRAEREDPADLSLAETVEILEQLLSAGNETAARLIAFMTHRLAVDQGLQDRVRGDRTLVSALLEEMLRLETPVQMKFRLTTVDTSLAGAGIPARSQVLILFGSANRDERQFEAPDEMRLDRFNVRTHLAFGFGPHLCIGAQLARAEARIAVNTLLDCFGEIRLSPAHPEPEIAPSFVHRGLSELHVELA